MECEKGLYFPNGLWLKPKSLVERLTSHPNITVKTSTLIQEIEYKKGKWQIYTEPGNILDETFNLVLCNSHMLEKFAVTSSLALRKIRGQISVIKTSSPTLNQNTTTNKLKAVVCGKSYIIPENDGKLTIGATFKCNELDTKVYAREHEENINNTLTFIPQVKELAQTDYTNIEGKASIRSSTTDYLPLTGPVANQIQFNETYQKLAKDSNFWIETSCPYLPGLYINAGHGSKGLLSAPLCGEIIADYIDNSIAPGSQTLLDALHPNRILLKKIVRKIGEEEK